MIAVSGVVLAGGCRRPEYADHRPERQNVTATSERRDVQAWRAAAIEEQRVAGFEMVFEQARKGVKRDLSIRNGKDDRVGVF